MKKTYKLKNLISSLESLETFPNPKDYLEQYQTSPQISGEMFHYILNKFPEEISNMKIGDLGCGNGPDTLYLLERGYKVISADYSKEAIYNINMNIKDGEGKVLDMNEKFTFKDNSFYIIVADICLQFFNEEKTKHIMNEIKRILNKNGLLIARVPSVNDKNFGAGYGTELEKRYYDQGSWAQRFFNEEDLNRFFGIIGDYTFVEKTMTRAEPFYSKKKYVYQVRVV